jgi:hypothetical protein
MKNGSRRCPALIIFLKKRYAAETSRFAPSMNSMVWPSSSAARHGYLHLFPTLIQVSRNTVE